MDRITRGILVKKDGLYYRDWEDGEQLERKVDSFIPYLKEAIEAEDDVTFEDFFNHVMDEYKMISIVFASQLGHYDLGKWREEWACPFVDKPDGHTKTKHLEVGWATEWWDKGMDREVEEWVGFGGRGETLDESTGEWIDDMGISFSFTPINELKNYPFKINIEYKIFDWEKYKADKDVKNRENWFAVDGVKRMSVYDVIGGILDDISFYGAPDGRDKESEKLEKLCKETDAIIEEKGIEGAVKDGDLFEWDFDEDDDEQKNKNGEIK
jgi:hypothetical protein